MAYYLLGVPAKTIYRSTAYTSGYTDVHAVIERPDGQQLFVQMTEMDAPFLGVYQGEVVTQTDDPVGDYVVMVSAPSENRRDVTRMTFFEQPATKDEIADLSLKVQNLIDIIEILTL